MRVILDTNVWRYLADQDRHADLRCWARDRSVTIVVPPAIPIEMLATRDVAVRDRMLQLACDARWRRPMPEAYTIAMQMRTLIGRCRPDWLVRRAREVEFKKLRRDWTYPDGIWWRFAHDTDAEAARHGLLGGPSLEMARAAATRTAQEMDVPFDVMPGAGHLAGYPDPTPGWDGSPVDLWRIDADRHTWLSLMQTPEHPYADWLFPFIDADTVAASRESWRRMWLYDADPAEVPQQLIVSAVSFLQRTRSTTPGTPVDAQLANYLLDADVIVSADKALVAVIGKVGAALPDLQTARPVRLPVTDDALEALDACMAPVAD